MNEQSNTPESITAPSMTLGQWLVHAREAKGMTKHDVASRSNRTLRQIEQLEADDLSTAAAPNLLRAIVRHYAKVVGANPDDAVRHLPAAFQSTNVAAPARISSVAEAASSRGTPIGAPWMSKTALALLAAVVLGLLTYWVLFSRYNQKNETSSKITSSNQVQVTVQPEPVVAPIAPVAAPVVVKNDLTLKFKMDSWVHITDVKGVVLLDGIQKAGTDKTVTGDLPLKASVGNASNVEVIWKGDAYDLKPSIANKARDVAVIKALN